jgi:putative transposase
MGLLRLAKPVRNGADRLIDPGKPSQNGADESLNGKLRDECLSLEWFHSRAEGGS